MENNNHRQDIELTKLKSDLIWVKEKVDSIENQVFNHIPSQLRELNENCVKRTDFIMGIAGVIAIQILLKFFL